MNKIGRIEMFGLQILRIKHKILKMKTWRIESNKKQLLSSK